MMHLGNGDMENLNLICSHIEEFLNDLAAVHFLSDELPSETESDTGEPAGNSQLANDVNGNAEREIPVYDETLFTLPFRCTVCTQAFSKSFELTQHVSEHGVLEKRRYRPTGGGPPFICQVCMKTVGDFAF